MHFDIAEIVALVGGLGGLLIALGTFLKYRAEARAAVALAETQHERTVHELDDADSDRLLTTIRTLDGRLQTTNARIAQLETRGDEQAEELKKANCEIIKLKHALLDTKAEVAALQKRNGELTTLLTQAQEQIARLEGELTEATDRIRALEAENNALRAKVNNA